jgi:hypothetical protein
LLTLAVLSLATPMVGSVEGHIIGIGSHLVAADHPTLLPSMFAVQMLVPSKATPVKTPALQHDSSDSLLIAGLIQRHKKAAIAFLAGACMIAPPRAVPFCYTYRFWASKQILIPPAPRRPPRVPGRKPGSHRAA